MPNDDDFNPFESDKTVILPTPGGAAKPEQAQTFTSNNQQFTAQTGNQSPGLHLPKLAHIPGAERNCTLGNSLAIICYAAQLRHLNSPPDTPKLFNELVVQIKEMGENLRIAGQADEIIVTSRYLICSFIDEMVLNTPWGLPANGVLNLFLVFFIKNLKGGQSFLIS